MTQKMNLHISDVHCGQNFSQYGESAQQRVERSNQCIEALSNFQRDHRDAIGDVFIAGDLCQLTGLRGYNESLEATQLGLLGKGLKEHDGEVVYVAGSADPYMDRHSVGLNIGEFKKVTRQRLGIDPSRMSMPGLSKVNLHPDSTVSIIWHGHLRELDWDNDNTYDYLLNQRRTPHVFDEELVIHDLRQNEDTHQMKGMMYEAGYRKVISKLPARVGRFIDNTMMRRDRKAERQEVLGMNFAPGTTLYMGHTHSPVVDQLDNGVVIANSGSVTGAFRMDPEAEGTFITASDSDTKKRIDLWNIDSRGEYGLKESTTYAKV